MEKIKLSQLCGLQPHPIRKQMVFLPSPNTADVYDDFSPYESWESLALVENVAKNGVLEPIVLCGEYIVDGMRRLDAAKNAKLSPDAEIPVRRIEETDALLTVIASITTRRHMTVQQRVFNIYQFVRADHLKCLEYGKLLEKAAGKFEPAVPHFDLKTSGFKVETDDQFDPKTSGFRVGTDETSDVPQQTDYFSEYLAERERDSEISAPCVWLAKRIGCVSKYLTSLAKVWDYLESLPAEKRTVKFKNAVAYVNAKGVALNNLLPALEGEDSEREDLKPENESERYDKWFARCKSGFAGLAERFNSELLGSAPDAKKTLFEYAQTAGFKRDSAAVLRDIFADLVKQLDKQNS